MNYALRSIMQTHLTSLTKPSGSLELRLARLKTRKVEPSWLSLASIPKMSFV